MIMISPARAELPDLRAIVLYDDYPAPAPQLPGVMTWAQLLSLGAEQGAGQLEARLASLAVNQCAVLSYTSGDLDNTQPSLLFGCYDVQAPRATRKAQ